MNENPNVVLFDYWRSSASYRVRIGLSLLNIAPSLHPVDLLAQQQNDRENRARNPQGLVPTMQIDGATLTQSLAILEYLDETRQAGFLPADPLGRAKVRALSMAIAADIHPICNLRVVRHAVGVSGGAIDQQAWMQHFIAQGLSEFEAMLPDDADLHCYGDRVSLADICLVPQVYNARRWDVDLARMPRLVRIDRHLAAIPAIAAAAPLQA